LQLLNIIILKHCLVFPIHTHTRRFSVIANLASSPGMTFQFKPHFDSSCPVLIHVFFFVDASI
jgi:hypothetical protein